MSAGEQIYWSRLNQAVSSFCVDQLIDSRCDDKMICSLVGEELEWCGSHSYLFMATRYMTATSRISELEQRSTAAESSFSKEIANSSNMRKTMKEMQVSAEDNAWRFQEELAHANNIVSLEKATNSELRSQINELQSKLTEVEMYVNSDRGAITMQIEEDLAEANLKIVQLEADRDTSDFHQNKVVKGQSSLYPSHIIDSSKENRHVNWKNTYET
jgi:hypothetical protein